MEHLTNAQKEVIKKIAKENGLEEFEIIVDSGSDKGDNFMGVISNVTLKHDEKELNLVLKSAMVDETSPDNYIINVIYKKEIYMYENFFSEYHKLHKELNLKYGFDGHARVYGSYIGETEGFFIMDDLRKRGFKLWNKRVPMNDEHISAVIKEYAKFHSLAMILKNKKPEVFVDIKKNVYTSWSDRKGSGDDDAFKNYFGEVAAKLLRTVKDHKEATAAVSGFLPKIGENLGKLESAEFGHTIIHGDCWCNNMMFSYDDPKNEKAPSAVCFLDWQLSKCSSPAYDLMYYLFTTVDKEHLDNFKHYLKLYYDVLSENIASAGLDVEKIYTFSQLEDECKTFAFNGIMSALVILQLTLGNKDEVPDVNKLEDIMKVFKLKIENQDEYDRRIMNIVLFMLENDMW